MNGVCHRKVFSTVDSSKTRRDLRREETYQAIKAAAHQQMVEGGTAAVSLRGIAAQMRMSAAAIYRYFESRDALITALILDSFNALGDALEEARHTAQGDALARLMAVLEAYRAWAVAHPVDFQLIYGNPIPDYHAPRELTVPAVIRGFVVIVGLIEECLHSAYYAPRAPYAEIPPPVRERLVARLQQDGYAVSPLALYLGVVGWSQLHGIIMLELFNHLQPIVGDSAHYYTVQMRLMLSAFGLKMP